LTKLGHQVKLPPSAFVKAFNIRNKSDAADARAIWLAIRQPTTAVAVKTAAQQAVLALHRMRQQLVKFRTMQINGLCGLWAEYGEGIAKSRAALDKAIPTVLARLADRLPTMLIDSLREQWYGLAKLDGQIGDIELRLRHWMWEDEALTSSPP
jgi:transposase